MRPKPEQAMMWEMPAAKYHIFYDGTCLLCLRSKAWLEARDVRHNFAFVDSRNPTEMAKWPTVTPAETEGRMVVLAPDGQKQGGYDGIVLLMRDLNGWRWLRPLLGMWGIRSLGRWAYRQIARNRYRWFGRAGCEAGVCRI